MHAHATPSSHEYINVAHVFFLSIFCRASARFIECVDCQTYVVSNRRSCETHPKIMSFYKLVSLVHEFYVNILNNFCGMKSFELWQLHSRWLGVAQKIVKAIRYESRWKICENELYSTHKNYLNGSFESRRRRTHIPIGKLFAVNIYRGKRFTFTDNLWWCCNCFYRFETQFENPIERIEVNETSRYENVECVSDSYQNFTRDGNQRNQHIHLEMSTFD